ncbi:hypothetical protein KJ854_05210, partial [Patescibacteria group bacterium]|nr:hypothetical protein [Patescibacteria group bacterium]
MENIRESNREEREKEILSRLESIRNEKERLFSSKMESDEKRSKLKILEREERELNKEFNDYYNIAAEEEKTAEQEILSVDIKNERMGKEELQEMEEIIKKVAAEIEPEAQLAVTAAALIGDILYVAILGQGRLVLKRKSRLATILTGTDQ